MTPEIKKLKGKIKNCGLSYPQIYTNTGINRGWFLRMIRGDFIEPDPDRLKAINSFVDDWIDLTKRYRVQ